MAKFVCGRIPADLQAGYGQEVEAVDASSAAEKFLDFYQGGGGPLSCLLDGDDEKDVEVYVAPAEGGPIVRVTVAIGSRIRYIASAREESDAGLTYEVPG